MGGMSALAALPSGPLFGGKSWYEGDNLNMTAGPTGDWWKRIAMETMRPKQAVPREPPVVMRQPMPPSAPRVNVSSPAQHGGGTSLNEGIGATRQLVPVGLGAQQIPGMGADRWDPRQVPQTSQLNGSTLAAPSMAGVTSEPVRGTGGGGEGGGGYSGGDPYSEAVMAGILKGAATPAPQPMTQEQRQMMMMQMLFGAR